jgi:hypothetical protein
MITAQNTSHILMIRPVSFRYNEQTATNNHYQRIIDTVRPDEVQPRAQAEFGGFVEVLRNAGVQVTVVDDTVEPDTPDSLFPNNWVSFHADGRVFLYPMLAPNRRLERRRDIVDMLAQTHHVHQVVDLSALEAEGEILEGTGSMVLDRANKVAYACLSLRTTDRALDAWAGLSGFRVVRFTATQRHGDGYSPIYHTNVMMSLGTELAVVCADTVRDPAERDMLLNSLSSSGLRIVLISEEQKNSFAGNMLQLIDREGHRLMVMSSQAFGSLTSEQKEEIGRSNRIIHAPLDVIETFGGGSARCMMAEVFLPAKG